MPVDSPSIRGEALVVVVVGVEVPLSPPPTVAVDEVIAMVTVDFFVLIISTRILLI